MESIQDLAPEVQKRISDFERFLGKIGFSRPEVKNVGSILYGMVKSPGVYVTGLSRSLNEKITLKKTWERINRNLRRKDLGSRLIEANLYKNKKQIRDKRFCIIDISDIQKAEAQKMEGLSRVRDGDKSGRGEVVIGKGYWWLNGVMADRTGILPVYSELYSLDYEGREHASENSKIDGVVDEVSKVHPDVIYVLDRGGDRSKILDNFIYEDKKFVIRGQDQRSLGLHSDSNKLTNIKEIAKRTKTNHAYKSLKNGEWFDVGIRRVYYGNIPLWLVVSRRRRGGMSWYLTNVEGFRTTIINTVMEAYGYRWCVEEYHRQIKQDYGLEKIRLRKYHAIKNMIVFVMLAASFCALLPEHLIIKMLALSNRLPRKQLHDIPDYPYYMITAAISFVLEQAVKRRPKPLRIRKRDYLQLNLNLQCL
jgi:hypothetical protein